MDCAVPALDNFSLEAEIIIASYAQKIALGGCQEFLRIAYPFASVPKRPYALVVAAADARLPPPLEPTSPWVCVPGLRFPR